MKANVVRRERSPKSRGRKLRENAAAPLRQQERVQHDELRNEKGVPGVGTRTDERPEAEAHPGIEARDHHDDRRREGRVTERDRNKAL